MQKQVRVVVDAMGGDNAPEEIVKGAVEAAASREDIQIIFTGREEVIKQELAKYEYPADRVSIVNATEVIETAEPPVNAIRKKKDSSIVVGMNLVKKKEADAFVSSGSTGAVLVGGQVIVGRIKGVERPPLAPLIPDGNRGSLLVDCGANVDARSQSSGAVCKDGFHLYGKCGWSEKSQSWRLSTLVQKKKRETPL